MTISLRNLPPEIEEAIRERSRRDRISLNKATRALLEKAVASPARNADFDEFRGRWSAQQADEFDVALAEMRSVDPRD